MEFEHWVELKDEGQVIFAMDVQGIAHCEIVDGEPSCTVDSVWLDDVDMLSSNDLVWKGLGEKIKEALESDNSFQEAMLSNSDIYYTGKGSNDPDGYYYEMD